MNQVECLYLDTDQPIEKRVDDLVGRLTLKEKISQMISDAPAVDRLGIPAYHWRNECLHGVARNGVATVFPQALGLAATWNKDLVNRVATAISDEARAKHHEAVRKGKRGANQGLTFWSPNINILRDPRWGRGQETYGEDPYLTSRIAVEFIKGLQGDHPRYLKVVATAKHFAVHSGPDTERHHFDAVVDDADLYDTYLPAFEACVKEAEVASIMGAYNRTNGEPCCASPTLLQEILREKWGFDGYVVSDCAAIDDIFLHHCVVDTPAEASALAVSAGCDLECGIIYKALEEAFDQGLISEDAIDQAVKRLFTARFRLGMFDPAEAVPYAQIPHSVNDCAEHRELALVAARESIVLLKNDGILPLNKDLKKIAVIGPNADDKNILWGNYHGVASKTITPLAGISAKLANKNPLSCSGGEGAGGEVRVLDECAKATIHEVAYAKGCPVLDEDRAGFAEAIAIAKDADVVIFVAGLNQQWEREVGPARGKTGAKLSNADRPHLNLPGVQEELLQALHATGTPVVLVLINGGPVTTEWANDNVSAILEEWYPGEEGGTALADVLFGDYNPAGRLPVTVYQSVEDLPEFDDYRMQGRTYRYFQGEPLFPFGYGLSYTRFAYQVGAPSDGRVSVRVENCGKRDGEDVVQLYVQRAFRTNWELAGFERAPVSAGEAREVVFDLPTFDIDKIAAGNCAPNSRFFSGEILSTLSPISVEIASSEVAVR